MLRTSARATQSLRLKGINGTARQLTKLANARVPLCAAPHFSSQYSRSFHLSAINNETVKVPQMAESISEGILKQWLKKKGDYVEVDEEVATIETDKIDVSVNAPSAGTITELFAEEEDTVAVGNDLFKIEAGDKPSGGSEKAKVEPEQKEEPKKETQSSDSKRRPPQEHEAVKQKEDVPTQKAPQVTEGRQPSSSSSSSPSKPAPSSEKPAPASASSPSKGETKSGEGNRGERRVKMNSMRKRIAERLKQSQNTAASLTTFNEIDMSALIALRNQYKDRVLKEKGVKIGFMGPFTKAACLALTEFPAANASIEGAGYGDTTVYHDFIDVSVAVATPKGLVVPVIRNAEDMSFLQIEEEIARLGKKARDNKLTLEDMSGGTFTISNGGVFGSLYGTPILNSPQSAVLGLHSIKEKPYVVNGKIEIRPIMIVALTYDHRLLDGREAVSVLVRIKEFIENPSFMLLQ